MEQQSNYKKFKCRINWVQRCQLSSSDASLQIFLENFFEQPHTEFAESLPLFLDFYSFNYYELGHFENEHLNNKEYIESICNADLDFGNRKSTLRPLTAFRRPYIHNYLWPYYIFLSIFLLIAHSYAVILSGSPNSYARYSKWANTFENNLSFDFRTQQSSALLLYTDDGGAQGNFYSFTISDGKLQIDFRLGDDSSDISGTRPVHSIRIDDIAVNDNQWHRLFLFQAWENVKIQLDDVVKFKILNQQTFVFGSLKTCSDVFIGGVPKDIHVLGAMSAPLRRHTKTLAGSVRNLVYRIYPQGVTLPQLIEGVGIRQSEDDFCWPEIISASDKGYCKNGGLCYSLNEGPMCDCSFTDFEGPRCEKIQTDSELSFFGQEWVGYDVSNNTAASIRSRFENISFSFKTIYSKAILFIEGDKNNYLCIMLDNGTLVAISKFAATEKRVIRLFNQFHAERFDDDRWHTVIITRSLAMMTMIADGVKDEIRQYAPDIDWLTNSYSYVGGMPNGRNALQIEYGNFRGCMKKVKYEADALLINFIELADQGYGQSVIRSAGDLAFSCRKQSVPADILSFNSGQHYLTLPSWNSLSRGSIGFQIRTNELDGLILYHGSKLINNETQDYIAFELIDGHLFFVINLGSGHVRLQTTASKINDGTIWHSVIIERMGRTGTVIVDNVRTDFSTPGVSANLMIGEPIYIGAVPWSTNDPTISILQISSSIWTGNLRLGYIGCLKNVRINGISSNIAAAYEEQKATLNSGITYGCVNLLSTDHCASSPCKNFARCENGYSNYRCECPPSIMGGHSCDIELEAVEFSNHKKQPIILNFPTTLQSEAETIECKFRTMDERGILFDATSLNSTHRLLIILIKGELELHLDFGSAHHTFNWGMNLNDNRVHMIRVKRRGEKVLLFLDGRWEHNYYLPSSDTILKLDKLTLGYSAHNTFPMSEDISIGSFEDSYDGLIFEFTYNGYDLLKNAKKKRLEKLHKSANEGVNIKQGNRKSKRSMVTFETNVGRVVFSRKKIATIKGIFRISFKFRTVSDSAIILALVPGSNYQSNFVLIELYGGKIRYTFGYQSYKSVFVSLGDERTFSDLRWHTTLVYQIGSEHFVLIDNTSAVMNIGNYQAKFDGDLYLGGLSASKSILTRPKNINGFRGCLSSLRLGEEYLDILNEATEVVDVSEGCTGPSARCEHTTCLNGGKCVQEWNSLRCNCSFTTYIGTHCERQGTTYIFDSTSSMIFYEYHQRIRPSTVRDVIAIGFQTRQLNAVLLSVQCAVDSDFLTIYLDKGKVHIRYNLGTSDHLVVISDTFTSDNSYHSLFVVREKTNLTLRLDKRASFHYAPEDNSALFTLNMQWRISIGASFSPYHRPGQSRKRREKFFDAFQGRITGVNFNGLMILDLLTQGSPDVHKIGLPYLDSSDYNKSSYRIDMKSSATFDEWNVDSGDSLIAAEGTDCFEIEQENCQIDDSDTTGLITPVLPVHTSSTPRPTTVITTHRSLNPPTARSDGEVPVIDFEIDVYDDNDMSAAIHLVPPVKYHPASTTDFSEPKYTGSTSPRKNLQSMRGLNSNFTDNEAVERKANKEKSKYRPTEPMLSTPQSISTRTSDVLDGPYNKVVATQLFNKFHPTLPPTAHRIFNSSELLNGTDVAARLFTLGTVHRIVTTRPVSNNASVSEKTKYNPNYFDNFWSDIALPSFNIQEATTTKTLISLIPNNDLKTNKKVELEINASDSSTKKPSFLYEKSYDVETDLNGENRMVSKGGNVRGSSSQTSRSTSSSTASKIRHRTTYSSHTIHAVRPTTPMSDLIATTSKVPGTPTDFPRTALISIASLSVIIIIAIVVFCVFRCRQSGPSADQYPMVCNGKQSGYTPIPTEMSPQMVHDEAPHAAQAVSRSFIQARISQPNGYQPIKGAVIPNGKGIACPRNKNDNNGRKKEFKEWYV